MTTYQTDFLSEILDGETVPESAFTYFRGRLLSRVHALLMEAFQKRSQEEGLKQKKLAQLIHRSPEVVNRHLAVAGNWKLDTVADFLLGMRAELDVALIFLEDLAEPKTKEIATTGFGAIEMPAPIGGLNGSHAHPLTLGRQGGDVIPIHVNPRNTLQSLSADGSLR